MSIYINVYNLIENIIFQYIKLNIKDIEYNKNKDDIIFMFNDITSEFWSNNKINILNNEFKYYSDIIDLYNKIDEFNNKFVHLLNNSHNVQYRKSLKSMINEIIILRQRYLIK